MVGFPRAGVRLHKTAMYIVPSPNQGKVRRDGQEREASKHLRLFIGMALLQRAFNIYGWWRLEVTLRSSLWYLRDI